jgi:citrate lyase subunit beta/citryl-CoA lyase
LTNPADSRPRRSALYIPGANPRAIEKAAGIAADVLIFDLEDSVAPEAKASARAAVQAAVASRRFTGREVVVRINCLESPWATDDFIAVAKSLPDAILVPKVDYADDVEDAGMALAQVGAAHVDIWAMIETPLAVLNVAAIAARREMICLVAGTNDLGAALHAGIRPGRAAFVPHLAQIVLAARAHGRAALDGTYNDIRNANGFREECEAGRDLGFDGKTLIHPDQVAGANAVFAPTDGEVAWARAVVDAFARPENAGKGVIAVDGKMAERLHEQSARRIIAMAEAIASQELRAQSVG